MLFIMLANIMAIITTIIIIISNYCYEEHTQISNCEKWYADDCGDYNDGVGVICETYIDRMLRSPHDPLLLIIAIIRQHHS